MNVGIIGSGAMGCTVGGFLSEAGADVVIYEIERSIVDAIESNGVRIEMNGSTDILVDVPVSDDPTDFDVVDAAFVLTKSFDTAAAVAQATPMIGPETHIVTIQNGIYNYDYLVDSYGVDRVVGGYTYSGANTIAPGHVRFIGPKPTVIGGGDRTFVHDLGEILSQAGLPTDVVNDPEPHIWKKQLWNVARKPISALCELRNGPQAEFEETRLVATHLIEEAMAVARARNIEILSDDPVGDFLVPVKPAHYDKKSSILEDVQAGRRTEIEAINGAIVEYADELGIDVPYNRAVTALVRAKERGYLQS